MSAPYKTGTSEVFTIINFTSLVNDFYFEDTLCRLPRIRGSMWRGFFFENFWKRIATNLLSLTRWPQKHFRMYDLGRRRMGLPSRADWHPVNATPRHVLESAQTKNLLYGMVQLALPSTWCTFNTESGLLYHVQSLPNLPLLNSVN